MTSGTPSWWLWIYLAVMSFVIGTIWGSFFNVCIYRIPVKKSTVHPRSHCYSCGTMIPWYDNIPVISYFLLGGNCRFCGSHFGLRYVFVELLSGAMFLAFFLRYGPDVQLPFHWAFVSLLIIGVFTDIDHFILPDRLTIGGAVFAVATAAILGRSAIVTDEFQISRDIWRSFFNPGETSTAMPGYVPLLWALIGAAFGWSILTAVGVLGQVLFHKEGMGGGDIKLFAFLGGYLGITNCLWILSLSALLGALFQGSIILFHKLFGRDEYDEIALMRAATVGGRSAIAEPRLPVRSDADNVIVATFSSEGDKGVEDRPEEVARQGDNDPLMLRVARRTNKQLNQLPYGPYIALAAILVLMFHHEVNQFTREFLYLRPAPERKSGLRKLQDFEASVNQTMQTLNRDDSMLDQTNTKGPSPGKSR